MMAMPTGAFCDLCKHVNEKWKDEKIIMPQWKIQTG
jgi:hypothetical protein